MIHCPGNGQIHFWRLDDARYAQSWDSGLGAQKSGGRWNSKGRKVVYASADAGTAILEVAVHKGFDVLDGVRHVLTGALILDAATVFKVDKSQVPNPNWLLPGRPGMGQQLFADALLAKHPFVLVPSTVSRHSWNLLINPEKARGLYRVMVQETFGLDTRLHPPADLLQSA